LPKKDKGKAEEVAEKSGEVVGKGLKIGHNIALGVGRGLKKGFHKEDKEE